MEWNASILCKRTIQPKNQFVCHNKIISWRRETKRNKRFKLTVQTTYHERIHLFGSLRLPTNISVENIIKEVEIKPTHLLYFTVSLHHPSIQRKKRDFYSICIVLLVSKENCAHTIWNFMLNSQTRNRKLSFPYFLVMEMSSNLWKNKTTELGFWFRFVHSIVPKKHRRFKIFMIPSFIGKIIQMKQSMESGAGNWRRVYYVVEIELLLIFEKERITYIVEKKNIVKSHYLLRLQQYWRQSAQRYIQQKKSYLSFDAHRKVPKYFNENFVNADFRFVRHSPRPRPDWIKYLNYSQTKWSSFYNHHGIH